MFYGVFDVMRCERHGNGTGSGLVILLSAILVFVAFKVG
jgi:hypothetical protein